MTFDEWWESKGFKPSCPLLTRRMAELCWIDAYKEGFADDELRDAVRDFFKYSEKMLYIEDAIRNQVVPDGTCSNLVLAYSKVAAKALKAEARLRELVK